MPTTNDAVSGDPLIGSHFLVQVEGKVAGYFLSVSGLGSETAVIDHKITTPTGSPINRKISGRLSWGDVTLKRGVTTNLDFWAWRNEVTNGNIDSARMDGSIIMFDQMGTEVARWNFEKAWPLKVTGPEASSSDNNVAMEEVVLVHEYIERVT
jgi:phage tail-like protein